MARRLHLLPHGVVLLPDVTSAPLFLRAPAPEESSGAKAIQLLHKTIEGDSLDLAESVKNARQLKLIGPSNNGKSHLARCMAQLWVASGVDASSGRWIETTIKMTSMEEHLWSAREDSGDGSRREVWGPLRYLWELAKLNPFARFALILNESNRGGLFNILNNVWWEPRRAIGDELNLERDPPANLALIFTENPATADFSVVGGDDEALRTRLGKVATWAVVHGGFTASEREELRVLCDDKFVDMSHVGTNFAKNCDKDLASDSRLELLAAGEQMRLVRLQLQAGEIASEAHIESEDMSDVEEGLEEAAAAPMELEEEGEAEGKEKGAEGKEEGEEQGEEAQYRPDSSFDEEEAIDWCDHDSVLQAVERDGDALLHASKELKDDFAIVLKAVTGHGEALQYAGDAMKNDFSIVLEAVKSGNALEYASDELKGNSTVVLEAIKRSRDQLAFASKQLRQDLAFMTRAVIVNGKALLHASEELKENREVVLAAVKQDGSALKYASDEWKNDQAIVQQAVMRNGSALEYASGELKDDPKIVEEAFKSALRNALKREGSVLLKHASDDLKNNSDFLLKMQALQYAYDSPFSWVLEHASAELKNTPAFMIRMLEMAIRYNSGKGDPYGALTDRRCCAAKAGLTDPLGPLHHASKELKNDHEFMLSAVKRNCGALRYASEALQADRTIVAKAIKLGWHIGQSDVNAVESLLGCPSGVYTTRDWVGASQQRLLEDLLKESLRSLCRRASISFVTSGGPGGHGDTKVVLVERIRDKILRIREHEESAEGSGNGRKRNHSSALGSSSTSSHEEPKRQHWEGGAAAAGGSTHSRRQPIQGRTRLCRGGDQEEDEFEEGDESSDESPEGDDDEDDEDEDDEDEDDEDEDDEDEDED